MLKVDFTRIIPSDALIYVFTFIPGLLFLGAVGIANPKLGGLVAAVESALTLGKYTGIFAVLFAAFVIGAAFITFVGLIRHFILGYAWAFWYFSKPLLCKYALLPILNRLLFVPPPAPYAPPPKPKPRWIQELHRKATKEAFTPIAGDGPAFQWWAVLAKQLVKKRCGLEENELPATSLEPIQEILTEPTRGETHGEVMFITLHATGWSALAATYFAAGLRTTWFFVFAFFLIANGLLEGGAAARALANPDVRDTLRLRAVLRQFPTLKSPPSAESQPKNDAAEES